ncbi:MAG TPA: hypothetical protein VHX67_11805 [Acidimicrobiales bacterium]|jgi:hypothetical protein|nr:hypothetical protein [Acidimicrobiales bacterium]
MRPGNTPNVPAHGEVIDGATLYLCRRGPRWVVVIESPRVNGAVSFHHPGRDSTIARFELLARARQACPDAAIMNTDGALTAEDYEWRVDVRGIAARPGDLGAALHRELSTESADEADGPRPTVGRRCHWGQSTSVSGRPRSF